jgi:hypothetical protein
LLVVQCAKQVSLVCVVDLYFNVVQNAITGFHVEHRERARVSFLNHEREVGDKIASASSHEFSKNQRAIVIEQKIGEVVVLFLHWHAELLFIFKVQRFVEQKRSEEEIFLIATVDLEDHYLLSIVAESGGVYFIVCGPADASGVELQGFGKHSALAIYFNSHAVNDAFLLKLVYHPGMFREGNEVNVDPAFIFRIYVHLFDQLHLIIINANIIVVPVIFEHKDIPANFTNNVEVGAFIVITFRLRIGNPLSRHGVIEAN